MRRLTTSAPDPPVTTTVPGRSASKTSAGEESSPLVEFARAGLWPGLPRAAIPKLAAAGITGPDDVTAARLIGLPGIGPATANKAMTALADRIDTYDVAVVLHECGLPLRPSVRLAKELGPGAGQALRGNPWRLLLLDGQALEEADRLAASLGFRRDNPQRGPAVLGHLLQRCAAAGHTAWPESELARQAADRGVPDPAAAVREAVDSGAVIRSDDLLALVRYAEAEEALAEGLARLAATAEPWEPAAAAKGKKSTKVSASSVEIALRDLDDTQRDAIELALSHGVSLLTGGPGTGKSRTVAALVAAAQARGKSVALAAPTGRAAKRLEELSDAPASTLHRLLGAQGTSGIFARDADWPLEADLVVVDETSMLDTELAAALVEACADGTHLLLVGDPAQLPSIGAGRVLGDLLEAKAFPTTELRTLYRHDAGGSIAVLASQVREGVLPAVDDPTREVVVVPGRSSAEATHRVLQLVTDSIPRALGIEAADVQVITPIHRGPAGTQALNAALKGVLNPGKGAHRGFDPGDRVVALANRTDVGFTNGEVGVVLGAGEGGGLRVAFTAGPVDVPRDAVPDLTLGFAITVHRAQGSEWPAVVMVLPPEGTVMLSRPLVYTAMTRAQRHLSVVTAVGAALARAVAAVDAQPRTTRLGAMLGELVPVP